MSDTNEISIGGLYEAIKKSWMKVLFLSFLCALVAFILLKLVSPRYVTEARILISPSATFQNPVAGGRGAENNLIDKASILSQIQVIQSRDTIAKVIDNLDLINDSDFKKIIKSQSGGLFSSGSKEKSKEWARELIIDLILTNLQVVPLSESRVIGIRYHSSNPVQTAEIANGLSTAYLEWQKSEKVRQNQDDTIRLSRLIADLKDEVKTSEATVADYRAQKGIFKSSSTDVTLGLQQLTELNSRIIAARERRADTEIRAKIIREMLESDGEVANATETMRSRLMQRLFEQKNRVQRTLAELGATLLASHPRIIQVRSELRGINQQIRTEMRRIVNTMENDAKIARAREGALLKSLEDLKNQSTRANGDEIQLRALEREARTNRDLLNIYMSRFRDAEARKDSAIAPAYASIVSKAHVPSNPYFPKTLPYSMLVFVAIFLIGIALVILKAIISQTSPQERNFRREGSLAGLSYEEEQDEEPASHI